jgi:hypothetical protein
MGLSRLIVLAPAAHSCPVEYLVSKIERFSSDTNNQGLKSCIKEEENDPQRLKSLRKTTTPHASPNFSTTVPK